MQYRDDVTAVPSASITYSFMPEVFNDETVPRQVGKFLKSEAFWRPSLFCSVVAAILILLASSLDRVWSYLAVLAIVIVVVAIFQFRAWRFGRWWSDYVASHTAYADSLMVDRSFRVHAVHAVSFTNRMALWVTMGDAKRVLEIPVSNLKYIGPENRTLFVQELSCNISPTPKLRGLVRRTGRAPEVFVWIERGMLGTLDA